MKVVERLKYWLSRVKREKTIKGCFCLTCRYFEECRGEMIEAEGRRKNKDIKECNSSM